jgi:Raf kinase inhibitor-like YbhB/YbcL family protein
MIKERCKLRVNINVVVLLTIVVLLAASISCNTPVQQSTVDENNRSMTISSPAFEDGGLIPDHYTCLGDNTSPLLTWSKGPEGTKFYVLIVENLDAPNGITGNWILYNIPGDLTELHEGISTNGILETGAIQGRNYLGKLGYYGPCPAQRGTYRYSFTIYAVDKHLSLAAANREKILNEIKDHILASGQLIGLYKG